MDVWYFCHYKILKKNGALEIINSSHSNKISKHYLEKKTSRLLIDIDKKTQKNTTFLEYNIGDIAIMHLGLIHRSGINNSTKFRLTAGARYHNTISEDFNPFRTSFTISS